MELLSLISHLTKRKDDYFLQAIALSRKVRTKEKLEQRVLKDSSDIVPALERGEIRWEEYRRSLLDKTLLSSLSAVCLGGSQENSPFVLSRAWPIVLMEVLPSLNAFMMETEESINNGELIVGSRTPHFSREVLDESEDLEGEEFSSTEIRTSDREKPTWSLTCSRACEFVSSPIHFCFILGNHIEKVSQGFKFIRRFTPSLDSECEVCRELEKMGWQSLDSLPLPCKGCECGNLCRCSAEYK
jgi:hypothetical protein